MAGAQESPYFRKRRRVVSKDASESIFFRHSPFSTFGMLQLPLSFCLDQKQRQHHGMPTDHCSCQAEQRPSSCYSSLQEKAICLSCRDHLQRATEHFVACEIFQRLWKNEDDSPPKMTDNEEKEDAQVKLNRCVRHLCKNKCYMKAFAPFRDWVAFKKAYSEGDDDKDLCAEVLDAETMKGWRCILFKDSRTAFVDPQGKVFLHARDAMCALRTSRLEAQQDDSTERTPRVSNTATHRPFLMPHQSPLGLLEELFSDDPWRLLMSTILLNRTQRKQVDHVMYAFLESWPSCDHVRNANEAEIALVVSSLGMHQRRARGIVRFSNEYHALILRCAAKQKCSPSKAAFELTRNDIVSLFHCGDYAYDAYRLFIRKEYDFLPSDEVLLLYAEYQRARMYKDNERTTAPSKERVKRL